MNKTLLSNIALCITLAACGGGGGSSEGPVDNDDGKNDNLDRTPDGFTFAPVTGQDISYNVVSNEVTISGIDNDTSVEVANGSYSINGGNFSTESGAINSGDTLVLNQVSSTSYSSDTITTLTIGTVSQEFVVTTKADTAPSVSFESPWAEDGSTILSGQEELVLNFSEAMQTNTLSLSGDMVPDCNDETDAHACLNQTWSADETTLTLSPKEGFYWYSDKRDLEVSITGDGTLGLSQTHTATVLPVFETHQAADIVIGQDSMTSREGTTTDRGLNSPVSLNIIEESGETSLLITDAGNARIVKYNPIPTENYAAHSVLFGQTNSTTKESGNADNQLNYPTEADLLDGRVYITDSNNDRAIWLTEENFSPNGHATSVIGKDDFNLGTASICSASELSSPNGMELVKKNSDVFWLVVENNRNRVMVWKNPSESKGANASFVLGQDSFDDCTSKSPSSDGLNAIGSLSGIWSNGQKLIISSESDKRLLVWNEFPTETGIQPDFQLGQDNEFGSDADAGQDAPNQKGFGYLSGIGGNDHQICVTDTRNNRVTIWSELPESSEDLADVVIGQRDFITVPIGVQVKSQTLSGPSGCDISMEQLFVSDSNDDRVLIYNALNKHPGNN